MGGESGRTASGGDHTRGGIGPYGAITGSVGKHDVSGIFDIFSVLIKPIAPIMGRNDLGKSQMMGKAVQFNTIASIIGGNQSDKSGILVVGLAEIESIGRILGHGDIDEGVVLKRAAGGLEVNALAAIIGEDSPHKGIGLTADMEIKAIASIVTGNKITENIVVGIGQD